MHIAIVGAGIIGLAHAICAINNGHTVTIIERDAAANGASIRNFGHGCFTVQPTHLRPLAETSRKLWLNTARHTNITLTEPGTLVVARNKPELTVLQQLTHHNTTCQLLDRTEVTDHLGGRHGSAHGGALLTGDIRINPRTTVHRLAEWVQTQPGCHIHWATSYLHHTHTPHNVLVHTSVTPVQAHKLLICVGSDLDYLHPTTATQHNVTRCRLNMTRVATPGNVTIHPAVLTGTSMTRYGAFTEQPGGPDLLAHTRNTRQHLLDIGANVMCTQAPDGTLLVGDTHHYGNVAPAFMTEQHTNAVLNDLADVLGAPTLTVLERWQGVYAYSRNHTVLRHRIDDRTESITVTAGVGMTLSFGIAHNTFAEHPLPE